MQDESINQRSIDLREGDDVVPTTPATFPATLLERYTDVELIGNGASGSVFRGRNTSNDKLEAIKLWHGTITGAKAEEFARFAKGVAGLKDPYLVRLLDFGIVDGVAYSIYEFVMGETLESMLKSYAKLEESMFISIFSQVISGVAYAQRRGVFHGNLRPNNIMIEKDDRGFPIARVADFPLRQTAITPETMAVSGEPPTAASDVYAIGSMMYESLAGRPPEKPIKTFAELGVPVTSWIEQMVLKCLEPEPKNRFKNATAILDELRRTQDAIRSSPAERRKAEALWRLRNSRPIGIFSFLILMVAAALLVSELERDMEVTKKLNAEINKQLNHQSPVQTKPSLEKLEYLANLERIPAGISVKSESVNPESGVVADRLLLELSVPEVHKWNAYYFEILGRVTDKLSVPATAKGKIHVTVNSDQRIQAQLVGTRPPKGTKERRFLDTLTTRVVKLHGSAILKFPVNGKRIEFDLMPDGTKGSVKLIGKGHPLMAKSEPEPAKEKPVAAPPANQPLRETRIASPPHRN